MTLLRRARAGAPLMQAHNQHLFQRLIQAGRSHLWVSGLYSGLTLFCCAAAWLLWGRSADVIAGALAAFIVIGTLAYHYCYKRVMRALGK